MTSGDPVNKTFQIRKCFKTLLWVFSAWGIVNFSLIHIKQSPCYYFCFVLTFGPSNIFMMKVTFAVFLKIYFLNTALIPEYRRKPLRKQKGVSVCFGEGQSYVERSFSFGRERKPDSPGWNFLTPFSATELLLIKVKARLWFGLYVFSVNSLKNAFLPHIFLVNYKSTG